MDLAWHPHADIWVAVVALAVGYAMAIRFWGDKAPPGEPAITAKQASLFYSGVLILWLAADWPLHDVSERSLLSAHMVQHLILTFIVPPLLLWGMPKWLLRKLLPKGPIFSTVRFLTRPLIAFAIFNGLILITHWPTIVNASLDSLPLHLSVHWLLIGSAILMWWPVIAPLPELATLSEPGKMFYLFMQSILPTVPASFLTFATAPTYTSYEGLPHLWGLSTLHDQQIAGLLMKIGGGLLLWGAIAYIFFKWQASDTTEDAQEISWEDFERDLQARNLRV